MPAGLSGLGLVHVVDDEPDVCAHVGRLLTSAGYTVDRFHSPDAFLAADERFDAQCVVLEFCLKRPGGRSLQQELARDGCSAPIVFIARHASVADAVLAMKRGAVDFLAKPLADVDLLGAVAAAVEQSRRLAQLRAERAEVESRMARLTRRESQVLAQVVNGRLNKQIAAELGTAVKTIKVHRSRVMEKMGVRSVAELVHSYWQVCG